MKRLVYLFIITAFLGPVGGNAEAETMEERKQRIMRKYLRERQTLVQSDLELPQIEEDERISDSEKFNELDVDLGKERRVPPPQVPMAQPVPMQSQQNWLLQEEEDVDADPYADPFALNKGEERSESAVEWWAEWRSRQEEQAAEKQSGAVENFWSGRDSGNYDPGRQPVYGQSGYGQTDYSSRYGQDPGETGRSYYGSSPRSAYGSQPRVGSGPYGTTRYGSSPSSGMLEWSSPSFGSDEDETRSATGYTPYKSPYETRREQRQQTQQGYAQPEEQEFSRPTPYQKWKDDNQGWDPAADDAYLNELMRRNRR
jgi:hypothetical protein